MFLREIGSKRGIFPSKEGDLTCMCQNMGCQSRFCCGTRDWWVSLKTAELFHLSYNTQHPFTPALQWIQLWGRLCVRLCEQVGACVCLSVCHALPCGQDTWYDLINKKHKKNFLKNSVYRVSFNLPIFLQKMCQHQSITFDVIKKLQRLGWSKYFLALVA